MAVAAASAVAAGFMAGAPTLAAAVSAAALFMVELFTAVAPVSAARATSPRRESHTRPLGRILIAAAADRLSRIGRRLSVAAHFGSSHRTIPGAASRHAVGLHSAFDGGRHARAVQRAFNARPVSGALLHPGALRDPGVRARVTSRLATAGWEGGHHGWWRHRHGGFGWVGPVFWPFAFYDLYEYSLWGYGYGPAFWDYGYSDIYAGIFAPYGYNDLIAYSGYLPSRGGKSARNAHASANPNDRLELARMCGDDSSAIAGLPIDEIKGALDLDDTQRAALDDLAAASGKAAQDIKAACPTEVALTAPGRLAFMQQRIEAMIAAVALVRGPLDKVYGLLNDEQKARFNALAGKSQRLAGGERTAATASCGGAQSGLTDWPGAAIKQSVRPNEEQSKALDALQDAAAAAANMLNEACQPQQALTPPARLEAVDKRLGTMLRAIELVRTALYNFYGSLSDEQKAAFDAIGVRRTVTVQRRSAGRHRHSHRRHYVGIEHMLWRIIP